jgi:hypothetical protein
MKVEGNFIPLCHGFIYEGVELQIHSFFTSKLDGGDWSTSHPSPFYPGRMPSCVGPRTVMNTFGEEKSVAFWQKSNNSSTV